LRAIAVVTSPPLSLASQLPQGPHYSQIVGKRLLSLLSTNIRHESLAPSFGELPSDTLKRRT